MIFWILQKPIQCSRECFSFSVELFKGLVSLSSKTAHTGNTTDPSEVLPCSAHDCPETGIWCFQRLITFKVCLIPMETPKQEFSHNEVKSHKGGECRWDCLSFGQSDRTNPALHCYICLRRGSPLGCMQSWLQKVAAIILGKSWVCSYGQRDNEVFLCRWPSLDSGNMLWRETPSLSSSAHFILTRVSLMLAFTTSSCHWRRVLGTVVMVWRPCPQSLSKQAEDLAMDMALPFECTSTNVLGCWQEDDSSRLAFRV